MVFLEIVNCLVINMGRLESLSNLKPSLNQSTASGGVVAPVALQCNLIVSPLSTWNVPVMVISEMNRETSGQNYLTLTPECRELTLI